MSSLRYIRDGRSGTLILKDTQVLDEYRQKKTLMEEIDSLKQDINTLKTEMQILKSALNSPNKSN